MNDLIGLTGKARAGKDTVADWLVRHHGFTKMSFAGPLRDALLAVDPYVRVDILVDGAHYMRLVELIEAVGWNEAKQHEDVRRLMQRFGTDAGRRIMSAASPHKSVWVDIAAAEASHRLARGEKLVFQDVRFDNEAVMIRNMNGVVLRVDRPDPNDLAGENAQHPSERGINPELVSAVVANTGTVDQLYETVGCLLDPVKENS